MFWLGVMAGGLAIFTVMVLLQISKQEDSDDE